MKKEFVWLLVVFQVTAFAGRYECSRDCDVWNESPKRPMRVCRLKKGSALSLVERMSDTVFRISTQRCKGLIRSECVVAARRTASDDPELNITPPQPIRPRIGVEVQADALSAGVSYSSKASSGLGYGAALNMSFPLGENLRIRAGLGYQQLQLKQILDGSGALEDSNPAEFTQKRGFLSVSSLLGYSFNASDRHIGIGPQWWFEAGGEYDHPLTASQTTASGDTISFTPSDKLLLLTGGVRGEFPMSAGFMLDGFLRFYYNIGSNGGSKLYAFRFGGAIFFNL